MDPWRLVVLTTMLLFGLGPGWLRKFLMRRKIGRDPVLLLPVDTPHGCAQGILGAVVLGYWGVSLTYAFAPALYALLPTFGQPPGLPADAWRAIGAVMAYTGLATIWTAQGQMGLSWRFGPDHEAPPPLVTTGLFTVVRNPIYGGIMVTLLGEFLIMPDALSLALLATALTNLNVLVRLEEQFLVGVHGEPYRAYMRGVPRFLPGGRGTVVPEQPGL